MAKPHPEELPRLALSLIHLLELLVGRILATAMLKCVYNKGMADLAGLLPGHLAVLRPHLEFSLPRCEHRTDVHEVLDALVRLDPRSR